MEGAVGRLGTSEAGPSTPTDAQYQYQRALALPKALGENLYEYSNEQLKHLQAQSVLVYVFRLSVLVSI
jgi:ABC-type arginine/histidine transport system permease subunit